MQRLFPRRVRFPRKTNHGFVYLNIKVSIDMFCLAPFFVLTEWTVNIMVIMH